jgi:hypothetical protein
MEVSTDQTFVLPLGATSRGAQTSPEDHEEIRSLAGSSPIGYGQYSAAMNEIGVAAEGHELGGRLNIARRIRVSHFDDATGRHNAFEVRRRCRSSSQFMARCTTYSIRSSISSRGKSTSRGALLPWPSLGRVARSRDIDRRSRDGGRAAWRRASITLTPPRVSVRPGVYAGVIVSNVYGCLTNIRFSASASRPPEAKGVDREARLPDLAARTPCEKFVSPGCRQCSPYCNL